MEQSEFLGANQVETDPVSGTPVTKHSDTDTTLACKLGGMLCIDEVFRAPAAALMSIQSALEYPHRLNLQDAHGTARQIEVPLNDFLLVLTDNTTGTGDETGNFVAEVQDISTLNRIRTAVKVDYMKAEEEQELLAKSYPIIPEEFLEQMVKVAGLVRKAQQSNTMLQTMSIRELLTWCDSLMDLRKMTESFKITFLNKLSPTDVVLAKDIFRQVTGISIV
jgi:MoxR-like ATPase